jgi:glycosyltransferase involved in cell wall biosynthesis
MMTVIEPTTKVDILLATYNGGEFLADQLASIERQTFSEWRLIVRDDGSTDNTVLILEEFRECYPDKVLLIEDLEHNLGPGRNFERLLGYSDAPYFFFCDQDDVWMDS